MHTDRSCIGTKDDALDPGARVQTGTVVVFNDIAGYGYILQDDGNRLVRAPYHAIEREGYRCLCEGQRVRYELVVTRSGLAAGKVWISE